MESKIEKVVLIIADISGYTRFMIKNKTTLIHSQVIITELIKTIIKQAKIPLKVSKLEGDAVFTYAVREENESSWGSTKKQIGEKLVNLPAYKAGHLEKIFAQEGICNPFLAPTLFAFIPVHRTGYSAGFHKIFRSIF